MRKLLVMHSLELEKEWALLTVKEEVVEKQRDLYMCLVNFEKAFDMVQHKLLMKRLLRLEVNAAYFRVLVNLYCEQKAVMKIEYEMSGWTKIRRSMRQGSVL